MADRRDVNCSPLELMLNCALQRESSIGSGGLVHPGVSSGCCGSDVRLDPGDHCRHGGTAVSYASGDANLSAVEATNVAVYSDARYGLSGVETVARGRAPTECCERDEGKPASIQMPVNTEAPPDVHYASAQVEGDPPATTRVLRQETWEGGVSYGARERFVTSTKSSLSPYSSRSFGEETCGLPQGENPNQAGASRETASTTVEAAMEPFVPEFVRRLNLIEQTMPSKTGTATTVPKPRGRPRRQAAPATMVRRGCDTSVSAQLMRLNEAVNHCAKKAERPATSREATGGAKSPPSELRRRAQDGARTNPAVSASVAEKGAPRWNAGKLSASNDDASGKEVSARWGNVEPTTDSPNSTGASRGEVPVRAPFEFVPLSEQAALRAKERAQLWTCVSTDPPVRASSAVQARSGGGLKPARLHGDDVNLGYSTLRDVSTMPATVAGCNATPRTAPVRLLTRCTDETFAGTKPHASVALQTTFPKAVEVGKRPAPAVPAVPACAETSVQCEDVERIKSAECALNADRSILTASHRDESLTGEVVPDRHEPLDPVNSIEEGCRLTTGPVISSTGSAGHVSDLAGASCSLSTPFTQSQCGTDSQSFLSRGHFVAASERLPSPHRQYVNHQRNVAPFQGVSSEQRHPEADLLVVAERFVPPRRKRDNDCVIVEAQNSSRGRGYSAASVERPFPYGPSVDEHLLPEAPETATSQSRRARGDRSLETLEMRRFRSFWRRQDTSAFASALSSPEQRGLATSESFSERRRPVREEVMPVPRTGSPLCEQTQSPLLARENFRLRHTSLANSNVSGSRDVSRGRNPIPGGEHETFRRPSAAFGAPVEPEMSFPVRTADDMLAPGDLLSQPAVEALALRDSLSLLQSPPSGNDLSFVAESSPLRRRQSGDDDDVILESWINGRGRGQSEDDVWQTGRPRRRQRGDVIDLSEPGGCSPQRSRLSRFTRSLETTGAPEVSFLATARRNLRTASTAGAATNFRSRSRVALFELNTLRALYILQMCPDGRTRRRVTQLYREGRRSRAMEAYSAEIRALVRALIERRSVDPNVPTRLLRELASVEWRLPDARRGYRPQLRELEDLTGIFED